MFKKIIFLGTFIFGVTLSSAGWVINSGTISNNYVGPTATPTPFYGDRKITNIIREVRYGSENYIGFGLSNDKGSGRSADLLLITDITNAGQKATAEALIKLYERGGYLRYFSNQSRAVETNQNWFNYTNIYRVSANDYYFYLTE